MTSNPNRQAWFDVIAWSEGTSRSPATKCKGYDVIVTGIDGQPEAFTDFSKHPFESGRAPKVINSRGLASTASGRYQILLRFWLYYAKELHLPDFSPTSQDRCVIQQLQEHNALGLVDAGHFDEAITAVSGLWASLPGKAYVGQGQHEIAALRSIYQAAGGIYVA
jgi:muramidase (phage lysozyme)